MQSTAKIAVSIFLISSALVTASQALKERRDAAMGLLAFPRVGRAGPRTWQVPINDIDSEDFGPFIKRQMYAFPRVGRSDSSPQLGALFHPERYLHKPARRSDGPGMWFGPRLGRAVKDDENENLIQDAESENNNYGMWFGPRVGRSVRTDNNDMVQHETNERGDQEIMDPYLTRKKRQTKPL